MRTVTSYMGDYVMTVRIIQECLFTGKIMKVGGKEIRVIGCTPLYTTHKEALDSMVDYIKQDMVMEAFA